MTDPHQTAAALSEAQKRAVLVMPEQYGWVGNDVSARVVKKLAAIGLVSGDDPLGWKSCLTPLGLAVRTILEQRHD